MSELKAYQKWVRSKWSSKNKKLGFRDLYIMTAGLGEEAGEVLGVLKKKQRDGKFDKQHFKEELGDVLYYLTMICNFHGITLREVVDVNIEKLEKRYGKTTNLK
jgi:NTP pyrophosphatase (non-canonical NTP hydrolase)